MNKPLFTILLGYNFLAAGSFLFLGYAFIFPKILLTLVISCLLNKLTFKRRILVFLPETVIGGIYFLRSLLGVFSMGPELFLQLSVSIGTLNGISPSATEIQLVAFLFRRIWEFALIGSILLTIILTPFMLLLSFGIAKFFRWVAFKKAPKIRGATGE